MSSQEKNNVLIIRLSSFGDVLITSCVLRELKKAKPNTKLYFLVKKAFRPMIENNIHIDEIIEYDSNQCIEILKSKSFDYIIDLQNNQRTWKIGKSLKKPIYKYQKERIKRFLFLKFGYSKFNSEYKSVAQKYLDVLNPLGIYSTNTQPEFFLTKENNNQLSKAYICIAPGAAHYTKQWPEEYYIELIQSLKNTIEIVLIGGPDEVDTAQKIEASCGVKHNFVGKTSFDETAHLIYNSELLICNDSSVMHIGVALKKKVLVFFGSTVEEFGFFPYDTTHKVLENKSITCRPCTHIGRSDCPKKHFQCMKLIHPKKAFEEVNKLLECRG